ncbi:MAG TPA: hypothetical protein VGM64_18700 [Lacunisphaera sp.]|jgi:hypothetical protein
MNWNDLEAVWKHQELPAGACADVAMLKNAFESKRRQLAMALAVRDWAEASAGILVAAVYARIGWAIGRDAWPMVTAIIVILMVTVFFVRERIRSRRKRLGAHSPLLEKLNADIAELDHQRDLLLNLWRWYLGPITFAMAIFTLTLLRVAIIRLPPELWATLLQQPLIWALLIITGTGIGFLLWFAWVINRKAVQKRIEPRLEELRKLQRELIGSP